jgi:protein-disulfide isomerase
VPDAGQDRAANAVEDPEKQFTRLNAQLGIRDSAYKGDPAASVVLVEFSDFECPFCARFFRDAYQRIHDSYVATGKVRYVFRHLPLEDIHPKAFEAAEVAECSRRQGLFWQVHDQLFVNQRHLKDANLRAFATSAGAAPNSLDQCLQGSAREQVLKDLKDARDIGAGSTPMFLVGREQQHGVVRISHSIVGARSFEVFEAVLEEVIGRR